MNLAPEDESRIDRHRLRSPPFAPIAKYERYRTLRRVRENGTSALGYAATTGSGMPEAARRVPRLGVAQKSRQKVGKRTTNDAKQCKTMSTKNPYAKRRIGRWAL